MTQVLQMTLTNAAGKKMIFNVANPKAGLTEAEVNAAMQTIVDEGIFSYEGLLFDVKKSAKIVERNVTEFELNA